MRLGVLDIGSNTVHLLIVDAHPGAAPLPAWKSKISLRLAEHVRPDGRIDERAIDELRKCSPHEQDVIAALILEEIADDRRWDEAFSASAPALEKMADKVRAEIRAGRTRDMWLEDL